MAWRRGQRHHDLREPSRRIGAVADLQAHAAGVDLGQYGSRRTLISEVLLRAAEGARQLAELHGQSSSRRGATATATVVNSLDWTDADRAQAGHKGWCNWRAAAGTIGAWWCNSVQPFLASREFLCCINVLEDHLSSPSSAPRSGARGCVAKSRPGLSQPGLRLAPPLRECLRQSAATTALAGRGPCRRSRRSARRRSWRRGRGPLAGAPVGQRGHG